MDCSAAGGVRAMLVLKSSPYHLLSGYLVDFIEPTRIPRKIRNKACCSAKKIHELCRQPRAECSCS